MTQEDAKISNFIGMENTSVELCMATGCANPATHSVDIPVTEGFVIVQVCDDCAHLFEKKAAGQPDLAFEGEGRAAAVSSTPRIVVARGH